MSNVIIGIHGLANKPKKALLAQWWEKSIREGLEKNCQITNADFRFVMVHWADLLYKNHQHQDPAFEFDSLYNDQPYEPAADKALLRYNDSWRDDFRATFTEHVGSLLDKVKGSAGLDSAVDWLLDRKLKDLAFYYDEKRQIRDANGKMGQARQVLMDGLMTTLVPLRGEKLMLIAHSMGSIIAYDVLRDLGRQDSAFPIHDFVTIGSPLGLFEVKDRVYEERIKYTNVPVRTPTVVTHGWINYADRRDPVAFDIHLSDDYRSNDADIHVVDDLVLNDYLSPQGKRNSHKSYGYLRTPEISEYIREFLGA